MQKTGRKLIFSELHTDLPRDTQTLAEENGIFLESPKPETLLKAPRILLTAPRSLLEAPRTHIETFNTLLEAPRLPWKHLTPSKMHSKYF